MKKQTTDWEKTFERLISDERLSSKIYKEHLKCNNKKLDSHLKKWAQDLNRFLIKEDKQLGISIRKHWKNAN